MTDTQHSAEKDLLRLIENPAEAEKKKSERDAEQAPVRKISLFSFRKRKTEGVAEAKKKFDAKSFLTDRKLILRLLFAATLGVFVYFVVTVFHEYSKAKNTKNLVKFTYISSGRPADASGSSEESNNDLPDGETSALRNIFKPDSVKKEEEKKDDTTITLNDYRLVGISQSSEPGEVYAMIKNAKTNITFFLKKGERLDGMELANIFDNKVILKVKGHDVELR